MSAVFLDWRSVTPSNSPLYFVKGTVLAIAIVPGTLSRFAIAEIRTWDGANSAVRYSVRDASTVLDADIRNGKSPREVASFDGIDAALNYCQNNH